MKNVIIFYILSFSYYIEVIQPNTNTKLLKWKGEEHTILRATSHTRLRAHDHYASSTLNQSRSKFTLHCT